MRRKAILIGLLALTVGASACASDADVGQAAPGPSDENAPADVDSGVVRVDEAWGVCDPAFEASVLRGPTYMIFEADAAWVRIEGDRFVTDHVKSNDQIEVAVAPADLVRGELPEHSTAVVHPLASSASLDAAAAGATLLIPVFDDRSATQDVAALLGGEFVFLGSCGRNVADQIAAFGAEERPGESPEEILLAILTDADKSASDFVDWYDSQNADEPEIAWEDQDPEHRLVDVEETPAAIYGGLDSSWIFVDLPDSWTRLEAAFCIKLPGLGWGGCFQSDGSGPVLLPISYDASGRLELWISTLPASTVGYERLATVETDLLVEANARSLDSADDARVIAISTTSDVTSLEDVRQQLQAGLELDVSVVSLEHAEAFIEEAMRAAEREPSEGP